jgi:hypothetical protein
LPESSSTSTPAESAGLDVIQGALRARIDVSSLRTAAREVGMSPTGLQKVLRGAAPSRSTQCKLEAWYLRHLEGEHRAASELALETLLQDVPRPRRDALREQIRNLLREERSRAQRPRSPG